MKYYYRNSIVAVLFIVFVGLFYFVYDAVKNKTIAQFNSEQILLAKTASLGISAYLDNCESDLDFLSRFPDIIDFNQHGQELIKIYFQNWNSQIEAVTRVNAEGIIIYTYPENNEVIGQDISSQSHMSEALRTKKPVISDVFTAVQGYLAIAIHVPVFEDEKFAGTLAVLVSIDKIGERYLKNIHHDETGFALLLSQNNIEIYSPFPDHQNRSIIEINKQNQGIIDLTRQIEKEPTGFARCFYQIGETGNQKEQYVNFYRLSVENAYWTILIFNSRSEVYKTINSFMSRLVPLFLLSTVLVLVYFYFFTKARKLVKEEQKRKIAEEKYRESEIKYHSFFENSMDAILLTSPDGGIQAANPEACKMFGRTEEEICTIGRLGLIDQNDPRLPQLLKERKEKGKIVGEVNMLRSDGSVFPVEISSSIFNDSEGKEKTSMIIRDITSRKKAEEDLLNTNAFIQNILQQSPHSTWVADKSGTLIQINDACCQLLRVKPEEVIGEYNVMQDNVIKELGHMDKVTDVFNKGIPTRFEIEYNTSKIEHVDLSEHSSLILQASIYPIKDTNGTITGAVIQHVDVTAQKKAGEAIQKLNQELEQKVAERTSELETKLEEVDRMNRLFVDRELRMVELKEKLRILEDKLKDKYN